MAKPQTLAEILSYASSNKASDVHLGDGICPAMRVDTELVFISEEPFVEGQILRILKGHLPEDRVAEFEENKELDFSFGISDLGRFRVNLSYQRSSIACAIRALPYQAMTFEQIGFPVHIAENLVSKPSGLVLLTGPTGSGKTTTLASMIDYINERQAVHIVTIEDPIEFLFKNKKGMVNQREVGSDTKSFNQALRRVLRQDPDVILIGEMRDLETIEIALTCAETGHLVFASLHTPDAVQSINRMIDVFPAHQQQQVRVQVSFVLQAVISQQLIHRRGGGLSMAPEILMVTPAVRNLIREAKTHQVYSAMQVGQREGMRTLNMSLAELVKTSKISREEAYARSSDLQELERLLITAK